MLNPHPEKQYSVNQCLEIGCCNSLFKKTHNGCIIDINANNIADDTAQANPTLADNGVETPTPQSF